MCVSLSPARLGNISAFSYATLDTTDPRTLHINGFQAELESLVEQPNCLVFHFPGNEIGLISGPEKTARMMADITQGLPLLQDSSSRSDHALVESTGQYYVVVAEDASKIVSALEEVPQDCRPPISDHLAALVSWYQSNFPGHAYAMVCFQGRVRLGYPIVVEYIPHNDDLLFVPAIVSNGGLPDWDSDVDRDFKVAFASEGHPQPLKVRYRDRVATERWAPSDVTGLHDNRSSAPNKDYVIPLDTIQRGFEGMIGNELLEEMI
jgi:hypothetical protein